MLEFLVLKKVWAWRNNTGAVTALYKGKQRFFRFGAEGSPDVFAVLPSGKVMHIECKGAGGKLSASQKEWQEKAVAHGHYYVVVRDVSELCKFFGGVK